jgi:anti-sigma factor RsiW
MDDPDFVLEESFPEFILDEDNDAPDCPDALLADGEPPADAAEARARFLAHCPDVVAEIREDERNRREREADKENHRPDEVVEVPEPEKHV